MIKVKNYINAYRDYVKTEREKFQALKNSNMYSQEYLIEEEKKMNQAFEVKRQDYLKGINEVIDSKLADIKKPDTSTAEYQAAVSNIFTKVQLLGKNLTPKLLKEIMEPATQKQDNSTIEAVRNYIHGIPDIPGGDPVKMSLLESAPRIVDKAELLENARQEISSVFNDKFDENLQSAVALNYLDKSGVFEL